MFKQNEKYYQRLFQICYVKHKSLIIAIPCFILQFILLCVFNVSNQEIFSSSTHRSIIGFYISVFIPVFGVGCHECIS